MDETRRRIVEAIVALHEEIGPARTTVKAIAERAGVERLTVYRHFPDEAALLAGCSSHWAAAHPPPDPQSWADAPAGVERAGQALRALYVYFAANARMLDAVTRDLPDMPELQRVTQPFLDYLTQVADNLARDFEDPAMRIVLRTLVAFPTWQALQAAGATTTPAKVRLAQRWLNAP